MSYNTAQIILVVLTLLLYVIFPGPLSMALATIVSLSLLIPGDRLKRILGYVTFFDVTVSGYIWASLLSTGAYAAIPIAVFATLGLSVGMRVLRTFIGSERLAIDGDASFRGVFTKLGSQAIQWAKSIGVAMTTFKAIEAPAPLNISWIKHSEPKTFGEVVGPIVTELRALFDKWFATKVATA